MHREDSTNPMKIHHGSVVDVDKEKSHANSGEFLFRIKSQDLAVFFLKKSKLVTSW